MTAEFIQYAKDIAQAERELKIEQWVGISFEVIRHGNGSRQMLHHIDIPHRMLERWQWVIEWRTAKLKCRYPRDIVRACMGFYDKRTGLDTGMNSLLSRMTVAKAQITKVERAIARYIDHEAHNNLFFVADPNERLQQAQEKLERKKQNYTEALGVLRQAVEQYRQHPKAFRLYIGFQKLGEFDSYAEARQYAGKTSLSGVFNILGEKGCRDAWYVSKMEIQQQKQAI
jgi:hypothetical protein